MVAFPPGNQVTLNITSLTASFREFAEPSAHYLATTNPKSVCLPEGQELKCTENKCREREIGAGRVGTAHRKKTACQEDDYA